jgi:cytoskeleton protein RodZ
MDQSTGMSVQRRPEYFRPRPDGDIDPAGEAGWFLQRERERRGFSLEDVAAATGVHASHLEAIETGDLTGLPARAEALAMIGAYGKHLGFDPQPLVLHYANFLPHPILPHARRRQQRPIPLGSAKVIDFGVRRQLRRLTSGAGGIMTSCLAAILLMGAASYWLLPSPGPEEAPAAVAGLEERKVETTTADDVPVASIAKVSEEALGDDEDVSTSTLGAEADRAANALGGLGELIETDIAKAGKDGAADAVAVSDLKVAVSEPTVVQESAEGRVYGSENTDARLVLTAKGEVWLRIEDRQGKVVVTRTLNAGDSYRVPNREGLVVTARDGGLISYRIDGKPGGDLGEAGEILVGRPLDLESLAKGG